MLKIICTALLLLVIQTSLARPQGDLYLPPEKMGYDYEKPKSPSKPPTSKPSSTAGEHEPGMPFDFEYNVNDVDTSNDFTHKANSDGDVTRGEYRVVLPDNRVQVVKYTADWKNGYNAEISYE